VVAYSAKGVRFKEIPFVDSLTSSAHFVLPAVFGVVLADGSLTPLTVTLLGAFFCGGWPPMLLARFRTFSLIGKRGWGLSPP